jgi:hypothetical protein
MQLDQLKRREFITLLGRRGCVVAARGARAAGRANAPYRRAVSSAEDDLDMQARVAGSGRVSRSSDGRRIAMLASMLALRPVRQINFRCSRKSWLRCNRM